MKKIHLTFLGLGFLPLILWIFCPRPLLLEDLDFSQAVYDSKHRLLRLSLSANEMYRLKTPLVDIAPQLVEAVLLKEDKHFFHHPGVNPVSLLRAFIKTYFFRSQRTGGSTITMQVARLRYKIPSRHLSGKIRQILVALALERHYTKTEILTAYFNLAPYGHNIEGVGAASLVLFGKNASELSLPESLALAVLPQNPNHFALLMQNGDLNRSSLGHARKNLFQLWLKNHPQDHNQAIFFDLPLASRIREQLPFAAPHFVNTLLKKYPEKDRIISTLDLDLQARLERHIKNHVEANSLRGIHNAAGMIVDFRTMEIKALVGSASFFDEKISGQVNGTTAKRSPGSTLKPFVYALAIDQGLIHPQTLLKDTPSSFSGYDPENFDRKYMGPLTAKDALTLSRNVPAVALAENLHNPNFYKFLESTGIKKLRDEKFYGLSTVLGGAEITMHELVTLYALLANHGELRPLKDVRTRQSEESQRLISPEASFVTLDMLKNTARPHNENQLSADPVSVAWKTGTSFSFRDAWTVGIAGPYVIAVWIGNFNGRSDPGFIGRLAAAPLFFSIIDDLKPALKSFSVLHSIPPKNYHLKQIQVCALSGQMPKSYCPHRTWAWYIPGTSPIKTCDIHRRVPVHANSNRLACSSDGPDITHKVYEFWPSDLMSLFKLAGIPRASPPPFDKSCPVSEREGLGLAPQIFSPDEQVMYYLKSGSSQAELITFKAASDADSQILFWFVDNEFVGQSRSEKPLFWAARTGDFRVKVVDENGRSSSRSLGVRLVKTR